MFRSDSSKINNVRKSKKSKKEKSKEKCASPAADSKSRKSKKRKRNELNELNFGNEIATDKSDQNSDVNMLHSNTVVKNGEETTSLCKKKRKKDTKCEMTSDVTDSISNLK